VCETVVVNGLLLLLDYLNNNNNNYKTSIAPISSKRIELAGTPIVQDLVNFVVRVRCKIHRQLIIWIGNLGRISESDKVSFQMVMERNYTI